MTIHQWRAFIGPRYEQAEAAHRFEYWTPGNLTDTGELDATLSDGATAMTLVFVPFDTRGGVWVGPNGSGEGWEYVAYTDKGATQLTGCMREGAATREHNGVHTAGATVRQWWPIDDDNGTLRITEELSETLCAITWTAQIEGIKASPPPLRPDHVVVVQESSDAGATWTTLLVGFTRNPTIRDDYRRRREWTLEIVSVAQILAGQQAPGVRIGAFNLAKYGSASTDTVLADPRKESLSGEYTASNPDLTGASAIDGDPRTLWFAERFVGTPADYTIPAAGYDIFLLGARINRYPGETEPSRWLEWRMESRTYVPLTLCNSQGNTVLVQLNLVEFNAGDTMILCEDEATFRKFNPHAAPTKLYQIGSAFFDELDPASDALGWYSMSFVAFFGNTFTWGDNNDVIAFGHHNNTWSGDPLPAMGAGQVLRYDYNDSASQLKDHWVVDYIDMAGYKANDGEYPWIAVALPILDLAAGAAMTNTTPGAGQTLKIIDSAGYPSTVGLDATGTIQIGTEQITYSARSAAAITITARGANATTAAAHAEGDAVRVLADGQATLGRLIEAIEWGREQAPYLTEFRVYRSLFDSRRSPGADGWASDWELVADVTGHASTDYNYTFSPAVRATAILIRVDKMSADPARVRINDVSVIGSAGEYVSGQAIAATSANQAINALMAAGNAYVQLLSSAGGATLNAITTEYAPVWDVVADMADYGGCMIDCLRDGSIAIYDNPLRADGLVTSGALDEDEIAELEYLQQQGAPASYVRLTWIDADGLSNGPVEYPANHAANAIPVDLRPAAYPDETTATDAAARRYILLRYPTTYIAQLATPDPTLRPGDVLSLAWEMDADGQPLDRVVIVSAVDHELSAGRWQTVLQLRQADREAPG